MYLEICMYVCICVCYVYMCGCATILKRGHKFERGQGGVYGRIYREQREVRNDIIIL